MALGLAVVACGETVTPPAEPLASVAAPTDGASGGASPLAAALAELDLNAEQAEQVEAVLAAAAAADSPGRRLELAVELRGALTDAQATEVIESSRARLQERRPDRQRGREGTRSRSAAHAFRDLDLTEEQRTALREIGESYREEVRALHDAARSESADREEIRERLQAIRTEMRERAEAVLTEGQRAQLEERRAAGEAERTARRAERWEAADERLAEVARILDLTDEQVERLRAAGAEERGRSGTGRAAVADVLTVEQRDALALARLLAVNDARESRPRRRRP